MTACEHCGAIPRRHYPGGRTILRHNPSCPEGGGVYVGRHAIDRFVERYPEAVASKHGAKARRGQATSIIFAEVTGALKDGRRSASEPRWARKDGRRRTPAKANRQRGTFRYVWNEERTRAYLIKRVRSPHGERTKWNVVTVLDVEAPRGP